MVFSYYSRGPVWYRAFVALAVLMAAAAFLWIGFFLAVGIALLLGSSLLVHRIRALWTRRRRAGPVILEGNCRRIEG